MLKDKFDTLKNNLGNELSDSQRGLLQKLEENIHDINKPEPEQLAIKETLETLLFEIEQEHPKAAQITKEILRTLENIGI